jgi:4-amino-4-deoxy-L-arabinose transferase-like glycosyltransferase
MSLQHRPNIKISDLPLLSKIGVFHIFLMALVVRLLNLFFINDYGQHAFVEDSPIYWNGAKYWIESGFFSDYSKGNFVHETVRVPGYYLFLIPFTYLFGDLIFSVLVAQSFVDSMTCMIIFRIGLFFSRNIGIVSGLSAVTSYNLVVHTSLILTETISLFILSSAVCLYLHYWKDQKIHYLFFVGLLCGFGAITRSVILLLPLVFAFSHVFIFSKCHRDNLYLYRSLVGSLVLVLAAALPVSPLLIRNYTTFDTIQLTSQNGVFLLNWVTGITRMLESGKGFDAESAELNRKLEERIKNKHISDHDLDNFTLSKERVDLAVEELSKTPVLSLAHAWFYGMFKNIMAPAIAIDPRAREFNTRSFSQAVGNSIFEKSVNFIDKNNKVYIILLVIGMAGAVIFTLLQLIGVRFLLAINAPAVFFLFLYLVYFLVISGPVGGPKYRIPLEPVLLVLQSAGLVGLLHSLGNYLSRGPDETTTSR